MSDRVAVMSNGLIEQIGTPVEVYEKPASKFVAGFIGISNVLLRDGVQFVVGPEKIRMFTEDETPDPGMVVEPGTVEEVVYVGMSTRYLVGWTVASTRSRCARIWTPRADAASFQDGG